MSSSLRSRMALVVMFGVFLIPLWTSSLRGLTHVLTCDEATDTDFSVVVTPEGGAEVLSSIQVTRGDAARELCGGLVLDFGVASQPPEAPELLLTISNRSEFDWKGSVQLDLDGVGFPVSVGEVEAGTSRTEALSLDLEADRTYEITGTLLVGP